MAHNKERGVRKRENKGERQRSSTSLRENKHGIKIRYRAIDIVTNPQREVPEDLAVT